MDINELNKDGSEQAAEDQAAINAVKRAFRTDDGETALIVLLNKAKFFDHCENEQDMAVCNFMKDLLDIIYWNREKKQADTNKIFAFIKNVLKGRKLWKWIIYLKETEM